MQTGKLIFLFFSLTIVSANAQETETKNRIKRETTVQQKADDWQEFKQPDFKLKFPQIPSETANVYELAEKSIRYSATDSKGIQYSIDRLEFGDEFWKAFEGFSQKDTIYNNLEMQQNALGATLLFKTNIFQQSISGRTSYFKLKEKNGEVSDLLQNAFKKDNFVYIVKVVMPVKTMRSDTNKIKDFPIVVKGFLDSFRFLPEIEESQENLPPIPLKPAKTPEK